MLEFESNYIPLPGYGADYPRVKKEIGACILHKRGRIDNFNLLFLAKADDLEKMIISAKDQLRTYKGSPVEKHFQVIADGKWPGWRPKPDTHAFLIYLLMSSDADDGISAFILNSIKNDSFSWDHLEVLHKHKIPCYYSHGNLQLHTGDCFYFSLNFVMQCGKNTWTFSKAGGSI